MKVTQTDGTHRSRRKKKTHPKTPHRIKASFFHDHCCTANRISNPLLDSTNSQPVNEAVTFILSRSTFSWFMDAPISWTLPGASLSSFFFSERERERENPNAQPLLPFKKATGKEKERGKERQERRVSKSEVHPFIHSFG